jgi:hypothetical protein
MAIESLCFVGTVHIHPRGPTLLDAILRELCQRLGTPAFVAVEAHQESAGQAEALRQQFESILRNGGLTSETAAQLSEVPIYEGRTVRAFCATQIPIVWLSDQADVTGWEQRLVRVLDRFRLDGEAGVLRSWSEGCFESHAYEDIEAHARDGAFFERVKDGIRAHASLGSYAIVVVGANHAARAPGRLCAMCTNELGLRTSQLWCTERWQWEIDGWLGLGS